MINLLLAAAVAALGTSFETTAILCRDDYEAPARRVGAPKIISGIVSKGLLTPTKQAVYATEKELAVPLPSNRTVLPIVGSGKLYRIAFRLYEFTPSARVDFRFTSPQGTYRQAVLTAALQDELQPILPVDVSFVVSPEGATALSFTSLADGSVVRSEARAPFFEKLADLAFSSEIVLTTTGGRAELTIDNYETALVRAADGAAAVPDFMIDPQPTFDPRAAGWKMVFSDEFDGPSGATFDHSKWYVPSWRKHEELVTLDGEGHLTLLGDVEPGTSNVYSTALWSQQSWQYGYFEARLKFTRNNGWWTAFWLYGESNRNPIECGSEIDIFEDYYTRYPSETKKNLGIPLDHNLHLSYGSTLKSYNCKSFVPGSIDDFHVIGCKWTPFEISIYADGKLLRSSSAGTAYPTVTFDPFNHNAIAAPLHVLLSGQIFKGWGPRDLTGCSFPEKYVVDYVRVWQNPADEELCVDWKHRPQGGVVADGTKLSFGVEVKRPVKAAYLFDNGAFLAARTEPPWDFEVAFSKEAYASTRVMRPGRQKKEIDWENLLHVYDVYVQDEKGRVGATREHVRILPTTAARASAVRAVPGTVAEKMTGRHTGEAHTVEIDVEATRTYETRIDYAACASIPGKVDFIVDGVRQTTVDCPSPDRMKRTASGELKLSKGRHRLTILPVGYLSLNGITLR